MVEPTEFLVRRAEPYDAEGLHDVVSCPGVIAGTLQVPFPSLERWRARIAETPPGAYLLVACADRRVVGNLGLVARDKSPRTRHVAELGIAVHDEWQRRGAGSALLRAGLDLADNWLALRRVELSVFVDNEAAIRLYQKFGFESEGTCRQYALRNGQYVDVLRMARLR